jgi:hypothetical protein
LRIIKVTIFHQFKTMGSSLGKSTKTIKRRSKSSSMKVNRDNRLTMLAELNPEEFDIKTA